MAVRGQWVLAGGFAGGIAVGALMLFLISRPPEGAMMPMGGLSQPAAVTIPFDPPMFAPLRYAYEMRTERDNGVQTIGSVDELTFLPGAAGGYTLRWKTRSVSVDAPAPARALLTRTLRLTKAQPLLLGISAQGVPVRILNEPKVRATADRMIARNGPAVEADFADVPLEGRAAMRQMMAGIAKLQREQSRDAFAETMLENPRLLLRNIGALVPGVAVEAQTEAASKVDQGRIRYRSRIEMRQYQPGKSVEVMISSVADAGDARRAMKAMIDPVLAAIPDPAQRQAAAARIADMGEPIITDESVLTIDLPSGLARSMVWRNQFYIPGRGSTTETRSYRRLL